MDRPQTIAEVDVSTRGWKSEDHLGRDEMESGQDVVILVASGDTYNSSTEAEAGGPSVQCWPRLCREVRTTHGDSISKK